MSNDNLDDYIVAHSYAEVANRNLVSKARCGQDKIIFSLPFAFSLTSIFLQHSIYFKSSLDIFLALGLIWSCIKKKCIQSRGDGSASAQSLLTCCHTKS